MEIRVIYFYLPSVYHYHDEAVVSKLDILAILWYKEDGLAVKAAP